ncbi:MAG: 2-amino-4-hydroxy-6-hydroxymethyldihydropteridine diphosphokinase [Clostridia bacterium]|nr:2-amino-4-hydroxy-6-hydroxymethyldihydropteridine diphosphokinase [Clostridia bacterium]
MVHSVFLALGSNMGDRAESLRKAIESVGNVSKTRVIKVSDIYETEPVGYTDQASFLNMAIYIETALEPEELLAELQEIELAMKRTREIHWGPRTIDIDILLYGEKTVSLPHLTIPHPRMFERAFVLVPLRDVYHQRAINGKDIEEIISNCSDRDGLKVYME